MHCDGRCAQLAGKRPLRLRIHPTRATLAPGQQHITTPKIMHQRLRSWSLCHATVLHCPHLCTLTAASQRLPAPASTSARGRPAVIRYGSSLPQPSRRSRLPQLYCWFNTACISLSGMSQVFASLIITMIRTGAVAAKNCQSSTNKIFRHMSHKHRNFPLGPCGVLATRVHPPLSQSSDPAHSLLAGP
jgi:hypothetical protein